jgi:hypothetical protein
MNIKHAIWEGVAVRMNAATSEAWMFNDASKNWMLMNAGDADSKAKLCNEAEFNRMFPDLPALPPEAFSS